MYIVMYSVEGNTTLKEIEIIKNKDGLIGPLSGRRSCEIYKAEPFNGRLTVVEANDITIREWQKLIS